RCKRRLGDFRAICGNSIINISTAIRAACGHVCGHSPPARWGGTTVAPLDTLELQLDITPLIVRTQTALAFHRSNVFGSAERAEDGASDAQRMTLEIESILKNEDLQALLEAAEAT